VHGGFWYQLCPLADIVPLTHSCCYSYEYVLSNGDVDDIYVAWNDLDNKQMPVAIVNTLPPRELPYLLKDYPPAFTGGQIWINVYSKNLCSRPFEPADDLTSTEALYPDLLPLDDSMWPTYEEYGLLPSIQCGNITNLHVRLPRYLRATRYHCAVTCSRMIPSAFACL
jgi:hypothetical protein